MGRRKPLTKRTATFAVALGVLLFAVGSVRAFSLFRARTFPSAPGIVQSVEVRSSAGARPTRSHYTPIVKYSYSVRGVEYTNDAYDVLRSFTV